MNYGYIYKKEEKQEEPENFSFASGIDSGGTVSWQNVQSVNITKAFLRVDGTIYNNGLNFSIIVPALIVWSLFLTAAVIVLLKKVRSGRRI